jgi:hypothetical protein
MTADDKTIHVFEDREHAGDWRVEYFDDDGGCYVTIFSGPMAQQRASTATRSAIESL